MGATCADCGRDFKDQQALGMHLKWRERRKGKCATKHIPVVVRDTCERCGLTFPTRQGLVSHEAMRRRGKLVCIDTRRIRARALERMRGGLA